MAKNKGGRPRYEPTDRDRATVKALAGYGIKQDDIAKVLGIHDETLRDKFRGELDKAAIEANAAVSQSLYNMATKGANVTAAIFWLKCRAGWKDPQLHEHSGPDGAAIPLLVTGVRRASDTDDGGSGEDD
ncbi:MAG TPA: hypothetical protein VHU42_18225 [Rhodopila sp.]|nr:hypothetical protein [Rhodopila sp.]